MRDTPCLLTDNSITDYKAFWHDEIFLPALKTMNDEVHRKYFRVVLLVK